MLILITYLDSRNRRFDFVDSLLSPWIDPTTGSRSGAIGRRLVQELPSKGRKQIKIDIFRTKEK